MSVIASHDRDWSPSPSADRISFSRSSSSSSEAGADEPADSWPWLASIRLLSTVRLVTSPVTLSSSRDSAMFNLCDDVITRGAVVESSDTVLRTAVDRR